MKTTTRNAKYPRRKRPLYPELHGIGDAVLVERDECGINIEHPIAAKLAKRPHRVLSHCFVFARISAVKPSRSNFERHVGAKQLARKTRRTTGAAVITVPFGDRT